MINAWFLVHSISFVFLFIICSNKEILNLLDLYNQMFNNLNISFRDINLNFESLIIIIDFVVACLCSIFLICNIVIIIKKTVLFI